MLASWVTSARLIKAVGVGAAIASLAMNLFVVSYADREMTEDATEDVRRIVVVLSVQTYHMIDNADITLKSTVREVTRSLGTPHFGEANLHDLLGESMVGLLQNQAIMMFDNRGDMLAHSRVFPTPKVNVADREYFKVHQGNAFPGTVGALFVGDQTPNRVTGSLMVPLSRRVQSGSGAFTGVIMAAVSVEYLSETYSKLFTPEGGEVYLKKSSGSILMKWPNPTDKTPLHAGLDYLSFSEEVPFYGLTVGINLPLEEVRKPWRPLVLTVIACASLSSLVIFLLSLYASFNMTKYEHWDELKRKVGWNPLVIKGGRNDNEV